MLDILLASLLFVQAANPCDPVPVPQTVPANTSSLILQFTHPADESIVGADVVIDGGPVQTQPAEALSMCASGRRAWQVTVPVGVAVGPHTAVVISWNYKIPGNTTSGKQVSTPVSVAFTAVNLPPPQTITATPATVDAGQSQQVAWTCSSGCTAKDWIGLFLKGASKELWWPGVYTNGAASGALSHAAPATAGDYEWRYCLKDGYTCSAVAAFTVSGVPPPPITKLDCTYALTFTVTTQNNVSTVSQPVITGSCK